MSRAQQRERAVVMIVCGLVAIWIIQVALSVEKEAWAQSVATLTQELRLMDDTDPRIRFMEADGTEVVRMELLQTAKAVQTYTGYAGTEVDWELSAFNLSSNEDTYILADASVPKLQLGDSTGTVAIDLKGSFSGIGGTHTGATVANVAAGSLGFQVQNSSSGSATTFQLYGDGDTIIAKDLTVDGEFTDARQTVYIATPDTGISADRYLSPAASSEQGWVASRSGAVVGLGGGCEVSGIPAGTPTFALYVRKNSSATALLAISGLSGSTAGWKGSSTTQTRSAAVSGSDTFSANDTLKCYIDVTIGGGESMSLRYCSCAIDVQLDS